MKGRPSPTPTRKKFAEPRSTVCPRCGQRERQISRQSMRYLQFCDPCARDVRAIRRYGTTYDELLQRQGGVCAICGREPGKERLHLDHDHKCCEKHPSYTTCGKCVRGLLCRRCNVGLNLIEEGHLDRALEYLKENYASRNR